MVCCLNPDCENPLNPDDHNYCQSCGLELVLLLRNRFKIVKPLSRGGFGQTYLAEDTDKLNRPCVIKQLLTQGQGSKANKKILELFMREAEQLDLLQENQQIPNLLAYFKEQDYLYLAQEYVNGQDLLRELQQQGPFSEAKILALFGDLLPVLEFIHGKGVIHRDLKPENIMRRSRDQRLILIDFGVARQISISQRTVQGTRVGSPGYFSVEQFSEGRAIVASDLFSLGATVFHLLSGQNPSDLWTLKGYSWVLDWHQYVPKPLSSNLHSVINQLLQIKAEERYQTAADVMADLNLQRPPHPQTRSSDAPSQVPNSNPSPTISQFPPPPSNTQIPSPTPSENAPQQTLSLPTIAVSPASRSSTSTSIQGPRSRNRRQFLTLALFGGLGLGSVVLWDLMRNGTHVPLPSPSLGNSSLALTEFDFEVVSVNVQGKIIDRNRNQAQFFTEDLGKDINLEMVSIPAGSFMMGSPENELGRLTHEGPQHQVIIPDFYMGKYPVTQAQWQLLMGDNPSQFKGENRPVDTVSWIQATEFCRILSQKTGRDYRLPSEAEWEYACRAGTQTPFYFGETITTNLANYRGTDVISEIGIDSGQYALGPIGKYRQQTTEIGKFPPNFFGLYDLHGNVLEWCQDIWQNSYEDAPTDGSAWIAEGNPKSYRIVRGGSWVNIPKVCRSGSRGKYLPEYKNDAFGLRVVFSTPDPIR